MYIVLILLQTVVLPAVSVIVQLAFFGGDPILAIGRWWAFWGVGTRLVVAGISQLADPARTTKGILGIDDAPASQIVQELGFANLSFGAAALLVLVLPPLGLVVAVPGAVYLGLAGVRHVIKRGKGRNEIVATWTDLIVFVAVVLGFGALVTAG